jgi:hypothetical protein
MSRSGYTDYNENQWALIRWRGQVASAIRGKRGQAFLRELIEALDAMPEKRLISHELQAEVPAFVPPQFAGSVTPSVCAIGSLGVKRGINLTALDPENYDTIADAFGIAHQLVQEVEWMNDEAYYGTSPEGRWQFMRNWAAGLITAA